MTLDNQTELGRDNGTARALYDKLEDRILMRELASHVGITERAVQRIVDDLTTADYLVVTKDGRRNRYQVRMDSPLRHELERHCNVGDLVGCVFPGR